MYYVYQITLDEYKNKLKAAYLLKNSVILKEKMCEYIKDSSNKILL